LAKKYRSIGKYKDALRCYQLGLEHFPIRPINSVDTLNLAALLNDMGQTMLLAGDTTKAIPYLEKAMKYPRTPGGGLAASMLKRIKERTER
jgi:tetratricopeptide (TPR) repeat protein